MSEYTAWQVISSDMAAILFWGGLSIWALVDAAIAAVKKDYKLAHQELFLGLLMFMYVWRVLATYQPLIVV